MKIVLHKYFSHPILIGGLLTLITLLISMQSVWLTEPPSSSDGLALTHYNNYVIFQQSFFHLIENQDLYVAYPLEYWDFYKYSPAFALFMGALAYLPDSLGLFLWNLTNVLVLFFALWRLPLGSNQKKILMLGFVLIELITATQNAQSNGLIAGLIILAFVYMEERKIAMAALFIVLTVFIKLFGIVALALFLFYPQKGKAFIWTIAWTIALALVPLVVVSYSQLILQYQSWFGLLLNDHSISLGLSVAAIVYNALGIDFKMQIFILGAMLFCIPLLKYRCFSDVKFRLLYLSSVLIWIIIFNHKAESPTFIIAVSGVVIWYFSQEVSRTNRILLILVFLFTILSPTDLYPRSFRENYLVPYAVKVIPCILVWVKVSLDLFLYPSPGNAIPQKRWA